MSSGISCYWNCEIVYMKMLYHLFIAVLVGCGCLILWRKVIRPLLRKHRNLERITLYTLAWSLATVLMLTWRGAALDSELQDHWFFEGIKVTFAVFGGDSSDFRKYTSFLPIFPEVLSCAVPLLTVFTTLSLLWNYLPHHVPWGAKTWYLFSDLDDNSIRMAKSLNSEESLCIFLRVHRGKQDLDLLTELQEINYFLYPQDEVRFLRWPWRRRHILRFFFLSEHADENFNRMRSFLEDVKQKHLFTPVDKSDGTSFQQELYLLSETESASMLIEYLRDTLSQDGKRLTVFANTELRLLDRYRAISYDLLNRQPLHKAPVKGKLNILVLGFGRIGREFFRAACSMGVIHNCTTELTICDQQISKKLGLFLSQCPELQKSVTFHPRKLDADSGALDKLISSTDFHYIVVALGDDERNIRVASRLKRHYRQRHWDREARKTEGKDDVKDTQPQICVNIEDSVKHEYTQQLWRTDKSWDRPLHVFGGLDQAFAKEVLMPEKLWNAARWIHRQLNKIDADTPLTWNEYERRSSIACAAHSECYVTAVCAADSNQSYAALLRNYTEQELDLLVDTEHQRWMAYVRSEGMRKATVNLVDVYFGDINNKHVDTLGKLTPCLVGTKDELNSIWEHLTANHPEDYQETTPFRKRDEFLVLNADIIKQGIEKGTFPDKAITSFKT